MRSGNSRLVPARSSSIVPIAGPSAARARATVTTALLALFLAPATVTDAVAAVAVESAMATRAEVVSASTVVRPLASAPTSADALERSGHPARVAPWLENEGWIVEALQSGTIVHLKPIGSGITNPYKAEIEFADQRFHAVWKPIPPGGTPVNESFDAEVAAYRLSRELGVNMVPPTVKRKIGRRSGSLQLWVTGHQSGEALYKQHRAQILKPEQLELMRFFDALVDNTDRHANNFLVDETGNIVLIDHSRSMNYDNWGPQRKGPMPVTFRADVVNRLRSLSVERLHALIGDLFGRGDVRALHRSAQRLLTHVEETLRQAGST